MIYLCSQFRKCCFLDFSGILKLSLRNICRIPGTCFLGITHIVMHVACSEPLQHLAVLSIILYFTLSFINYYNINYYNSVTYDRCLYYMYAILSEVKLNLISSVIHTIVPNNKSMMYLIVPNGTVSTICYICLYVKYRR